MELPRSCGILLHITSLPGKYGIGDLGEGAYEFVDFLQETGQTIWQVLPLGPTGYGNSPYQANSSFAGNPLLVSLDRLIEVGWLAEEDLLPDPGFDDRVVNYGPVIEYHNEALNKSFARFMRDASPEDSADFEAFCEDNAGWLDDYALFAALKDSHGLKPWWEWPIGQRLREPDAVETASSMLEEDIRLHQYRQWLFYTQWGALRSYANEQGILLMGDIPIFVAHDSADAWCNRDIFYFDDEGNLTVVAGVPPDYFSPTGQRWGNPLYRWDMLRDDGYRWWKERLKATLKLVDLVRIDHFRGFEQYWEVPAEEETAENGEWVDGPKAHFFKAMQDAFGSDLPIVAEDLGVITEEVEELRDTFDFPGMKILQFAFNEEAEPTDYQPHSFENPSCIVYTGTHDNDTTWGWWNDLDKKVKDHVQAYMGVVHDPPRDLMRLGMMSVARAAIIPLQDILGLGTEARMNYPGNEEGIWWRWRFQSEELTGEIRSMLGTMTRLFGRWPVIIEEETDEQQVE